MAYVLGYFAADGNMLKNKRGAHFIEFKSTDKELIERVRNLLGSDHKLSVLVPRPKSKHKLLYRLQIGSKEIYNDLIRLGFTPAKSNIMSFPSIKSDLFADFVRGYFDGDGHVGLSHYNRKNRGEQLFTTIISGFTSGSEKFLKVLHEVLKKYAGIRGGSLYHTAGYHLTFSVKDSEKLLDFLYKNAGNLYLARKREIFNIYYQK